MSNPLKGIKKAFKAIGKAFKAVGKFFKKIITSKWFKWVAIAAGAITLGYSLFGGVAAGALGGAGVSGAGSGAGAGVAGAATGAAGAGAAGAGAAGAGAAGAAASGGAAGFSAGMAAGGSAGAATGAAATGAAATGGFSATGGATGLMSATNAATGAVNAVTGGSAGTGLLGTAAPGGAAAAAGGSSVGGVISTASRGLGLAGSIGSAMQRQSPDVPYQPETPSAVMPLAGEASPTPMVGDQTQYGATMPTDRGSSLEIGAGRSLIADMGLATKDTGATPPPKPSSTPSLSNIAVNKQADAAIQRPLDNQQEKGLLAKAFSKYTQLWEDKPTAMLGLHMMGGQMLANMFTDTPYETWKKQQKWLRARQTPAGTGYGGRPIDLSSRIV